VLAATQTVAGFLLLTGFAAPLALVILAPITLQIFLFHMFLTDIEQGRLTVSGIAFAPA
jgi:hypothetical protein